MKQALTDAELRVAMEELARREGEKGAQVDLLSRIKSELFDKQVDFLEDTCKRKAVLGSRRAGKTALWARYATIKALENPRTLTRIWHSSRLRAKDMMWAELAWLHNRHGIEVEANLTELTITFKNGSLIKLVGADKAKEAEKKRGDKTILEIVLEAQNFGLLLRGIIDDIIDPSLLDHDGTLCVEGTPGAICAGAWYEISGADNYAKRWRNKVKDPKTGLVKDGVWSCHRWTLLDNPHLPHARNYVLTAKLARGWGDDHPTYLREYLGQWVDDLTSLFYKFDPVRNTYTDNEVRPWGPGWSHSLGWDLGFRDDMALVIWGWHPEHPNLYEVFSWKQPGALAKEVMDTIAQQELEKGLNLITQVADTGGGGKMYVEEVMSRYDRHFTAAKKTEKYEHVRLFNDELMAGRIKLRLGSLLQEEMAALMKDPDWPPPDRPEAPPREEPSQPNHCLDACLYSWRACWHFVEPFHKVLSPHKNTEAWLLQMLEKEDKRASNEDASNWGFGAGDEDTNGY